MKKLIAVDIDGTLINSNKEINQRTKDALIKAQEEGNVVVISSGRSPIGVMKYAKELKLDEYEGYICNYNGARTADMKTDEIVINHTLALDKTREMLKLSDELDIFYVIYFDNKIYTQDFKTYNLDDIAIKNDMLVKYVPKLSEKIDFEPNNILFTQHPENMEEPSNILEEKFGEEFEFVFSEPFYFEAMPKEVSKGKALLELAEKLNISKENVIAFGDQMNDYTMIEMAGVGVAMANAVDELKNIADHVTSSNDEDGIAKYLEEFVFTD